MSLDKSNDVSNGGLDSTGMDSSVEQTSSSIPSYDVGLSYQERNINYIDGNSIETSNTYIDRDIIERCNEDSVERSRTNGEHADEWTEYLANAPEGWDGYWKKFGEQLVWHSWCEKYPQVYGCNNSPTDCLQENSTQGKIKDHRFSNRLEPESIAVDTADDNSVVHVNVGCKYVTDSSEVIDWNDPVWCDRYREHYWETLCHYLENFKKQLIGK